MPAFEQWSMWQFRRGKSAVRGWRTVGATNDDAAIAMCGIAEGASHPRDSRLIIPNGGILVTTPKGPELRQVLANYDTPGGGPTNPDPTDEEPELAIQWQTTAERVDKGFKVGSDEPNLPIVNTARDPYDDGIPEEMNAVTIVLTRWESTYNLQQAMAYTSPRRSINSDKINIPKFGEADIGQLRIKAILLAQTIKPSSQFARVSYVLEGRGYYLLADGRSVTGFAHRVPSKGRQGWCSSGGQRGKGLIVNKTDRNPVSQDILLDKTGVPRHPDQYVFEVGTADGEPLSNDYIVEETDEGCWVYHITNPFRPFEVFGLSG